MKNLDLRTNVKSKDPQVIQISSETMDHDDNISFYSDYKKKSYHRGIIESRGHLVSEMLNAKLEFNYDIHQGSHWGGDPPKGV